MRKTSKERRRERREERRKAYISACKKRDVLVSSNDVKSNCWMMFCLLFSK